MRGSSPSSCSSSASSSGVIIWRLQLGAKRRFEVAEQTLMAFQRASDGLSRLRDPFIYAHLATELPFHVRRSYARARDQASENRTD